MYIYIIYIYYIIYLDLPKGAEWMIRGAHTPSLGSKQNPWKMLVHICHMCVFVWGLQSMMIFVLIIDSWTLQSRRFRWLGFRMIFFWLSQAGKKHVKDRVLNKCCVQSHPDLNSCWKELGSIHSQLLCSASKNCKKNSWKLKNSTTNVFAAYSFWYPLCTTCFQPKWF